MNRLARRLAPRTLRGRLSLVALTTAALLMTVLTVVSNTAMDRHLQHQADDELRNRAAAVATTVDTSWPECGSWRPSTTACSTRTCESTPGHGCWRNRRPPRPTAR
jgi:hypothetical protein